MFPHGSVMRWNISLTLTNPTLKRGSSCTMPMNIPIPQTRGVKDRDQDHCIMPRCVDSMSQWRILLSNIHSVQVLEVVVVGLHYTRHHPQAISRLCGHCFGTVWVSTFEALRIAR